jgi:N-methylhydantoinase A
VGDFLATFHRAHDKRYGYADAARAAEIVNVRARVIGLTKKPELERTGIATRSGNAPAVEMRRALFGGRALQTKVHERAKLHRGNQIVGPAIVSEYSATTVVPPGWRGSVDPWGNLILSPRAGRKGTGRQE